MVRAPRARGLPAAVLSNGSPEMLSAAVASAGFTGVLDPLLSVHEVATFKPDPRVYQLAVERVGVPAGQILFVSSNAWDAHAAADFGMRAVWVQPPGRGAGAAARRAVPPDPLAGGAGRPVGSMTVPGGVVRALRYAAEGGLPGRSLRVALVVGTVLTLIKQGDVLMATGLLDGWKALLTYVVPYVVSTYGAVSYRMNLAGKGERT